MPRLPYPPPQHIDSDTSVAFPPRQIQFRHPGYDPPCDTLFTLPGAGEGGSLHHETARLACALVASNRLDGFLSEDREGQEVLPADTEFQLVRGHYYFQVPKLGTTGTSLSANEQASWLIASRSRSTLHNHSFV
jgi:hypothetical protein